MKISDEKMDHTGADLRKNNNQLDSAAGVMS